MLVPVQEWRRLQSAARPSLKQLLLSDQARSDLNVPARGKAKRRNVDAYICMYHDQALIPLKMIAFDSAVNTTLGLPVPRTSVDHGTACDIAWQGKANGNSLVEAVLLAAKLAR